MKSETRTTSAAIPNNTRLAKIDSCVVIAGLDPAIHSFAKTLAKKMDTRVKPGHDRLDFLRVV